MSPGHCSDEQLIAHLDGELRGLAARSVRRHLTACWQCRGRMRELEEQALRLAKAVAADTFPGPERFAPALERFTAWQAQERAVPRPPRRNLRWIAAAACLVAMLGALGLRRRPAPAPMPSPDPAAIILRTRHAEESVLGKPVHQALRVEIATTGAHTTTNLELWSDLQRGRFAFEWRQSDGRLKQAVWKQEESRTVRFDPARDEVRYSFVQLTASAADLQQLEAGLYRWLRSRSLTPISLSAGFAEFAAQDGASVRVDRPDPATARIIAATESRELVLEVDLQTSRPRSLLLRVRGAREMVELRIEAEKSESLPLQAAVFAPKIPAPIHVQPATIPPAAAEVAPVPDTPDFEGREIEVYFVLHRLHACLGDQVSVERDHAGTVMVRGLVETAARKSELLAALRGLPDVKAAIETVDEAARRQPPAAVRGSQTAVSLQVDNVIFPMRDLLTAYFRGQGGGDPAHEVARLANDAVSLSGAALAEAWAIHRLTQEFPSSRPDPLGLVKQMLQDHAARLAARLRDLRELLGPVLPAAASRAAEMPASPLASAQQIDDLVRSLFSGSRSSESSAEADLQRLAGALSVTNLIHSKEREP